MLAEIRLTAELTSAEQVRCLDGNDAIIYPSLLAAFALAAIPVIEAADAALLHITKETTFGEESFERLYAAVSALNEAMKP